MIRPTLILIVLFFLFSCGDNSERKWNIEPDNEKKNTEIIDISEEFFDTEIGVTDLREKYPFYFSNNVSDSVYERIRRDTFQQNVYKEVKSKFGDYSRLNAEVEDVFWRLNIITPILTFQKYMYIVQG